MGFASSLITSATEYLGYSPKKLNVDLAVEYFRDCRNYPKDYTDERIEIDMIKNQSKIIMAISELDAKEGVEGQTSHSESGISRTYGDLTMPRAYAGVVQIVHVK